MLRFNQLLIAISLYHFLLLTKTHILKLYSDFSLTASWDWLILSKWNYQPWIQTQISRAGMTSCFLSELLQTSASGDKLSDTDDIL